MPVLHALFLAPAVVALILLAGRDRVHPFLAIVAVTAVYGFAADMSVAYVGLSIGSGFVQGLESVGLVVVAACLLATFAERSGATARLGGLLDRWRQGRPQTGPMAAIGVIGGAGGSATSAFAVLSPLLGAIAGGASRAGAAAALALGLLAGHAVLLPAPVPIAAIAILGADPWLTLPFGVLVATVMASVGAIFAARAARRVEPLPDPAPDPATPRPEWVAAPHQASAWVVVLPAVVCILLLLIQSIGFMPAEPLGGGTKREFLIGLGRPTFLLIVVVGLALLMLRRWDSEVLSERGWAGAGLSRAAHLLLIVGATGGLTKVLQNTGMPELIGERLLAFPIGLLLPFAVAATLKTLQGSSLVAAITTAGMIEPLLPGLGLDGASGRALAAVAVGAGSAAICHVNDGLFWLAAAGGRLTPAQGIALLSAGSAIQGAAAVTVILVLGAAVL